MKRIIGFFIVLVISTVTFSVIAQYGQNEQNEQNALRNVVERDTYGDNWFVSLGGNANLLVAEQDAAVDFTKRIKFGGAFTLGKWFNENFGARIQVMGGALRGFNYADDRGGYFTFNNDHHQSSPAYPMGGPFYDQSGTRNPKYTFVTSKDGQEGIWQDFNYGTATFDLMANFTNLMRGRYREHNPIDFIGFAGIGAIHAFDNKVTTPNYYHFALKIGFRVNFNISDKFSIYLEPQGTAVTDEFDGYSGTAIGDGIVNLGLGVQYTFNKRFTSISQILQLTADEIDKINSKINGNRYLIDNHQDILERQQDLLDKLKDCCDKPAAPPQVVETGGCLPEYVRFGLNSYKIEVSELRKIAEVADYIKRNQNGKLLIVGYADKKTGNPTYNLKLSQKRVEAVAAEMKRLGINTNRIISEWKGDKEQPFPQNEWNRVVVMVERK